MPKINKVFLDTSYAIALASTRDQLHSQAITLSVQLENNKTKLFTTRAILLEIGNALAKQRYRHAAVQLLTALERDPNVEIIPLSETLYTEALVLFSQRADKDWGLVDCISFIVMRQYSINLALTADDHFIQAGFQALLK